MANALGGGPRSGNFLYLTSAAKQHSLTEGTRDTPEISLTSLGRRAVYPDSAEVQQDALRQAFLSVPVFRDVLEHYGANNPPEPEFRENTLSQGQPGSRCSRRVLDESSYRTFSRLIGSSGPRGLPGVSAAGAPSPVNVAGSESGHESPKSMVLLHAASTTKIARRGVSLRQPQP